MPGNEADVKIGGIFIIHTHDGLSTGRPSVPSTQGHGVNAYAFAHEAAPHIQKGAEFARKGYHAANNAGLIDKYSGAHAGAVHKCAQRGVDGYVRLERAARDVDGVASQVLR